jgi:putative ABC transport system permease protein
MWTITFRDLQFRRRQFAIAVVGAGLAFALTLVLTGMSAGFRHEARETVRAIGADAWVVPRGVSGPFTSQSTIPANLARRVSGAAQAEPLATFGHVARLPDGDDTNVTVIGHSIGALGDPVWGRGSVSLPLGQAVVDKRLGVDQGETMVIASHKLRIVRVVSDRTAFGGQPLVYVSLRQAQDIAFDGRPLANAVVIRGAATGVPPGFDVLTNGDVRHDLLQPLEGAVGSIDFFRLLMWVLAAVIIAAITYLSALERLRDFAVLKAVGSSPRALLLSLSAQAVVSSLVAAALGAAVAQALAPGFPLPITIERGAYLALPVVAIVVGVVASLAAVRRAMRVDPALAFSGA